MTFRCGRLGVRLVVVGLVLLVAACGGPGDESVADAVGDAAGSVPSTTPISEVTPAPATDPAADPGAGAGADPDPGAAAADPAPTLPPTSTVPADDSPVDEGTVDVVFDVLQSTCASCHAPGGPGSTHWELSTFGDAVEFADAIARETVTGVMPPWPASDAGLTFVGSLALSDPQISAIRSWAAAGAPLGDLDEATPVVAADTGFVDIDADIVVAAEEPYVSAGRVVDDYRCQIFDPEVTEETWLSGWSFEPDQTEVIHHAVIFAASAQVRAEAEARDAQEPEAGWSCFGLSGLGRTGPEPEQIMGWAPGQGPTSLPDGTGLRLGPGDFIIAQVHYHFDDLIDLPADASTVTLDVIDDAEIAAAGGRIDPVTVERFLAPAEIPCSDGESGPLCDRDAVLSRIDAQFGRGASEFANGLLFLCGGSLAEFAAMTDGIASSSCSHRLRRGGEIVGLFGHMHELGAAFRMTLNPGTPEERILLDIPRWDFEWQLQYQPVESVVLERGDILRIECTWDRSLRSPDLEPAWVTWADGTDDEMCYSTVATRPVG